LNERQICRFFAPIRKKAYPGTTIDSYQNMAPIEWGDGKKYSTEVMKRFI